MTPEPEVTPTLALNHGLSSEEYQQILEILGRIPTFTELGIFSAMWSEHCSYKSSRIHLKRLPTTGSRVIQGPGENAGIVDLGDGVAAVFKMESHNHPSFIEPYQGAATGVGGILRDIFTMGARPIGSLNALRFGGSKNKLTRYLVDGVVRGIADYGNCVGIPTVGGEITFSHHFDENILVNVCTVGLVKKKGIFRGRASGPGNPVIYIGSRTGRDGIHGATMASEEFAEEAGTKRPTVQVGDPFTEKLLLEACLELMEKELLVGIQDMGAAGLTCSSLEMAARAGTGMRIDLDRVPRRETGMTPYEVMLSESQERMLLVAKRGEEEPVQSILAKWDLEAAVIGEVLLEERLIVDENGTMVADLPVQALVEGAPSYSRPMSEIAPTAPVDLARIDQPDDWGAVLETMLASPNLCSREWVYTQYDHMVQTNTVLRPGADAAILRLRGSEQGLALVCDGNPFYCSINPRIGACHIVAESARNLVCSGAEPIAITDCLNFGSPENPEVMWQFAEAVEGIREACLALDIPVVSGNVSFYNETRGRPIPPTPTIAMLGLLETLSHRMVPWFRQPGDLLVLLGTLEGEMGGTEYLRTIHNMEIGPVPAIDLAHEKAVQKACLSAIRSGLAQSAHDVSDGGLAIALAECCFQGFGAQLDVEWSGRIDALLFGEAPSRILLSVREKAFPALQQLAECIEAPCQRIGVVTSEQLSIAVNGERLIEVSTARLKSVWGSVLEQCIA